MDKVLARKRFSATAYSLMTLTAMCLLFNTSKANALSVGGFFVEPMVGYESNTISVESSALTSSGADTSGTSNGLQAGARVGGHVGEIAFLGLDGRYGKTTFADTFYQSADADHYDVSAMAGLQMPIAGLRMWANYFLAGAMDPQSGINGLDVKFTNPKGLRLGAGLHVLSASLNFEYQDYTYDTSTIQSVGSLGVNEQTTVDVDSRGYLLSLSMPMEF